MTPRSGLRAAGAGPFEVEGIEGGSRSCLPGGRPLVSSGPGSGSLRGGSFGPPRRRHNDDSSGADMQTTVMITGMHCEACADRLAQAFGRVPGVSHAHVTLNPARAHVEADRDIPVEALRQAARAAGDYSVRPVDASSPAPDAPPPSLYPLALIVLYITGASALTASVRGGDGWHGFMLDFMAGFFLVFSFFKLLDLRGFADAYQGYDLVARRWRSYALVY